ncbi:MAG: response regulator [Bacteroidales bacterium]|nr:response regulator [Bacteroidales bacterium]
MKKKILCIDDSNTALLLLDFALNEAGYQVISAISVNDAIQSINIQVPDLILLDLSMPAVSGYDFLKMKDQLKLGKVPIIVVSAYDSPESLENAHNLGAIDFISKPIKIDMILQKIRTYLNP